MNDAGMDAHTLRAFGVTDPAPLGEGGEGRVYAYGDHQVIKIYKKTNLEYLQSMRRVQDALAWSPLPYDIPRILDIGCVDGVYYTIEKRLAGRSLVRLFPTLSPTDQLWTLEAYFDALQSLGEVTMPDLPFGQVITSPGQMTRTSWRDYLIDKPDQRVAYSSAWLHASIAELDDTIGDFRDAVTALFGHVGKRLVHGDYCPDNVLMTDDRRVSAIIDFSAHTVVGDFRMDVAGAIIFLEVFSGFEPDHGRHLRRIAIARYGEDVEPYLALYRVFYGMYYADSYEYDRNLYDWCVRNITTTRLR